MPTVVDRLITLGLLQAAIVRGGGAPEIVAAHIVVNPAVRPIGRLGDVVGRLSSCPLHLENGKKQLTSQTLVRDQLLKDRRYKTVPIYAASG